MSSLEVSLYHSVNIAPNELFGTEALTLKPRAGVAPIRGVEETEHLGRVHLGGGQRVELEKTDYPRPENVPRLQPDTYYLTSKLAIAAMVRVGYPAENLLFVLEVNRRGQGHILNALGLGRAVFKRAPSVIEQPAIFPRRGHEYYDVQLTSGCDFPFRLFPSRVPSADPSEALMTLEPADEPAKPNYDPQPNLELTEKLGVPVYDAHFDDVVNLPDRDPHELIATLPNVHLALGARAVPGCVYAGRPVYSHEGRFLGGRSLTYLHPNVWRRVGLF